MWYGNLNRVINSSLNSHKEMAQVQLDVNRCGRRMPPGQPTSLGSFLLIPSSFSELSTEQRKLVQEQLSRIILRLLMEQRGICYYQGLHEVVLSILLVLGEDLTYAVMKKLTQYHLRCVVILQYSLVAIMTSGIFSMLTWVKLKK